MNRFPQLAVFENSPGVDIFFALSGYLICTLLLREQERTGTINLASFYTRRAFRILPPAVLYLSVVALCAGAGWLAVEPFELPTALFAANFFPDRAHYTQHFWSLSVEEHFYLVWPALLLFLGPRRACKIGLVLTAICVILRPWEAQVVEGAFRYQRSEMRLDSFVLPCYLAVLLREEKWRERGARWLTGSAMIAMLVLIVALSLVAERWTGFNTWNKFAQAALMPLLVVALPLLPYWKTAPAIEHTDDSGYMTVVMTARLAMLAASYELEATNPDAEIYD